MKVSTYDSPPVLLGCTSVEISAYDSPPVLLRCVSTKVSAYVSPPVLLRCTSRDGVRIGYIRLACDEMRRKVVEVVRNMFECIVDK